LPSSGISCSNNEAALRKNEFLAALGHELHNPMAPIRNAVEILKLSQTIETTTVDHAIRILDRQTAHLSRQLDGSAGRGADRAG
jgi:signal transduction histidine kinase